MNCQEFWDAMPELKPELTEPLGLPGGGQIDREPLKQLAEPHWERHLKHCPACAARLRSQRALKAGLRAFAGQMSHVAAPARVESRLRTAFHAHTGIPA